MTDERTPWWRRRLTGNDRWIYLGSMWIFLAALFGFGGHIPLPILFGLACAGGVLISIGLYRKRHRP